MRREYSYDAFLADIELLESLYSESDDDRVKKSLPLLHKVLEMIHLRHGEITGAPAPSLRLVESDLDRW